jgi:hypothetical protein
MAKIDNLDYVTNSTEGNATDFGNLLAGAEDTAAASNATGDRGVFGGGDTGSTQNVIQYITVSSTGNATDFGDLFQATKLTGACQNSG